MIGHNVDKLTYDEMAASRERSRQAYLSKHRAFEKLQIEHDAVLSAMWKPYDDKLEDITEQLEELRNTVQAITAVQTDIIRRERHNGGA